MNDSIDTEVVAEASDAIRQVAAELARIGAITRMPAKEFEQTFRTEFVHRSAEGLRASGEVPTTAKLAELTGLPESAIAQALAAGSYVELQRSRSTINEDDFLTGISVLVSVWSTDQRFTAVYGVPRELALTRQSDDDRPSFRDLVSVAMPQERHERVLQGLRGLGLVTVIDNATVRVLTQTVPCGSMEARSLAHYGRVVAGLMRNLRVNFERRLGPIESKPLELTLTTDRPIAAQYVQAFLARVTSRADQWLARLQAEEPAFIDRSRGSAKAGDIGRRYAISCFVSAAEPPGTFRADVGGQLRNYTKTIVLQRRFSDAAALDFRQAAQESAEGWMMQIDADKTEYAAPNAPGVRFRVTCFMHDVTGTEGPTPEIESIDLLEQRPPVSA